MTLEIIAEAAQGYLKGKSAKAALLIDMAAASKADAVKLQLVYADELCTQDYKYYQLFSELELTGAQWRALSQQARDLALPLYFDVFGPRSLEMAVSLGAKGIKIHSTDVLNRALMRELSQADIPRVVVSAGGTELAELEEAVSILSNKQLVLMHGFQGYPTPLADNAIARISLLKKTFPTCDIGFADHVPSDQPERFWLSAMAIGAGVTVLEKHITTALVLKEEDYESALNPDEFSVYVDNMQKAFSAMTYAGVSDQTYTLSASEQGYRKAMKKHVVVTRDLSSGEVLTPDDLALKRTSASEGIFWDIQAVQGATLKKPMRVDEPVIAQDVEVGV